MAVACSSALRAQDVTVRGVVYDSLHDRPLRGAIVSIGAHSSVSDSAGRFILDGIAPGTYRVTAQHVAIDRLGLPAVGTRIRVTGNNPFVQLSVPSFATLWRLACGTGVPVRDTGFVFGTARASASPQGIVVAASWIDLVARGASVSQKLVTLEVNADSLGNFALCGVPTNTGLTVRAVAADSSSSGTFDLAPMDGERLVRHDLHIVARDAHSTAVLTGQLLDGSGGGPVADAEVQLINTGAATRANVRGEYAFARLGPGSYRVHARKIGFADVDLVVDIEAGERRTQDIILNHVTLLDTMAVTGKHLARDEQMRVFEEHRKIGLGKFLTAAELEKARGARMSSLTRQWPGIYFPPGRTRYGPRDPVSTRGVKSLTGGATCAIALYRDGVKLDVPLDEVPPETLAGVEYYPGPASTPAEYAHLNNICGVMILHSRYMTGK
jgi:hypothetical protein